MATTILQVLLLTAITGSAAAGIYCYVCSSFDTSSGCSESDFKDTSAVIKEGCSYCQISVATALSTRVVYRSCVQFCPATGGGVSGQSGIIYCCSNNLCNGAFSPMTSNVLISTTTLSTRVDNRQGVATTGSAAAGIYCYVCSSFETSSGCSESDFKDTSVVIKEGCSYCQFCTATGGGVAGLSGNIYCCSSNLCNGGRRSFWSGSGAEAVMMILLAAIALSLKK